MPYHLDDTHPFFRRSVSDCQRRNKRRAADSDVQAIYPLLKRGQIAGGRLVKRVESWEMYKIRIADSSTNKGKSSGYRLIYALNRPEKRVVLLFLYHKKDLADVDVDALLQETRSYLEERENTNNETS